MNKLLSIVTVFSMSACSLLPGKDEPVVAPNKPVKNCRQQTEPKDPSIPCKKNDWYAEGDVTCSSTKEKCLKK